MAVGASLGRSYCHGCDKASDSDIMVKAEELFSRLDSLGLPDKVAAINEIRMLLAAHSPFHQEPVDCVQWVLSGDVAANDYNPNTVAPPEMELLEHSIAQDGYTQPIVAWASDSGFEVIDGFHRHRVGKECESVSNRVNGYLPLAIIRDDRDGRSDRIASTIRHNRARGKHRVEAMSDIVTELKKRNWTDKRIGKELGMDEDEVLRLCQISGLTEIFADADFSMSWDIGIFDDEDTDGLLIEEPE